MKNSKEKLHSLLENGVIKPRVFFSEPYALSRDNRDIQNDLLSFSFCEVDYLLDAKIAEAFKLIFDFFVDWRVCFEHKHFIEGLNERQNLLPIGNKFQIDFYKSEWEKQYSKSVELKASIDKKQWLSYLLENAIDLIYDFADFLFPLTTEAFIKRFKYLSPVFNINDSDEILNKNVDNFYDDLESFYLIERYFKLESLQKIYEEEVAANNIKYLNQLIIKDDSKESPNFSEKRNRLKVPVIALIHVYEGEQIARGDNANEIAARYGYTAKTSGEGLWQDYTHFASSSNRTNRTKGWSETTLKNRIDLLKEVITHLTTIKAKKRATDEIKMLESIFESSNF